MNKDDELVTLDGTWEDDLKVEEKEVSLVVPFFNSPEEVVQFSRKHYLPRAFQVYMDIINHSKDWRLKKQVADTLIEISEVKREKNDSAPAVVLNLGQEFLTSAADSLKQALELETKTIEVIEVDEK